MSAAQKICFVFAAGQAFVYVCSLTEDKKTAAMRLGALIVNGGLFALALYGGFHG